MAEPDATQHVIKVVRQLGHVAAERAELATYLGFEDDAAAEAEVGRRYHQLAGQARHVFDACDLDAAAQAFPVSTPKPPSVMDLLNRLTPDQRGGAACLICTGAFSRAEPDRDGPSINGTQFFIHFNPAVCTKVLNDRLSEECPF